MPKIFLSPSTQEYNPYIDGGNEEYYMNLIADEMQPYLTASGIEYVRNDPAKTVNASVAQSNAGLFNLHLAIHSNASAPSAAGKNRGVQIYFYPRSEQSRRAADIFAENYKRIYPLPELVKTIGTVKLAEVARTTAPAILIEVAYHDNRADAQWIRDNIGNIAKNLSESTAEFLGVKFRSPGVTRTGVVTTESGSLNLRGQPSTDSAILARIPKGTAIPIAGQAGEWYLTEYSGMRGYVSSEFVTIRDMS